jgi:hypothetical protein
MKKFLAITVACLYLAITSGLVLQIHYCMGKEAGTSVQFAAVNQHTCGVCGMQNAKNKCCHDEVKFVKLQDVHQQVTADYTLPAPAAIIQEYNLLNASVATCTNTIDTPANAPPDDDDGQPSLLIFHSIFRI